MKKEDKCTKIREHWQQGNKVRKENDEAMEMSREEIEASEDDETDDQEEEVETSEDDNTDDEEEAETDREEETQSDEEPNDIVLAIIGHEDATRELPQVASRRSGRTLNRMENSDFFYF